MGRKKKEWDVIMRVWSTGKCPTGPELVAAWAAKGNSQKDFIALLSILGELACFVDFSLEHKGGFGSIGGRRGGLKAFLEREAPELASRYKSVSRYMSLAKRFKETFNYYPPAALSLLHPDLPLPRCNVPRLTNYARQIYRKYLVDVPPEYKAFVEVLAERRRQEGPPKYRWSGMALPRDQWINAERRWRLKYVIPDAMRSIRADHSFYAIDYWAFRR